MRTPTSSRTAAGVLAAGLASSLVATVALTAAPATASDPGESTLVVPKSGTATSSWTGSMANPNPGAGVVPAEVPGSVDTHTLVVKAPGKGRKAKTFFAKNAATLDITVSWTGLYNDLDLAVFDANGSEVASDGAAPGVESESVSIPVGAPGTYTVQVTSYLAEPGISYDAVATLAVVK